MLPFLIPLITGLGSVLAETAANKLLGDGHPLAGKAKQAVLDVAEQVIGDKIGDRTSAEEAGIQISGDPAMKLEFQRLLNARLADDAAQETMRLQAVLSDVQSAREREAKTGDRTVSNLAYLVFGLWAMQTAWLFVMGSPEYVSETVLAQTVGGVTNIVMLVAGYYWGSSHLPRK
jgi:hypothetical protein